MIRIPFGRPPTPRRREADQLRPRGALIGTGKMGT